MLNKIGALVKRSEGKRLITTTNNPFIKKYRDIRTKKEKGESMLNDLFWMTLSQIKGIGSKTLINLYENYPHLSFENFETIIAAIRGKHLQGKLQPENIKEARKRTEKLIEQHEAEAIEMIPISSAHYPQALRLIPDPPKILFAKGNISLLKADKKLAIIGSRKPTQQGYQTALKIARTFAKKNYTIVSGLAKGIDTAAHQAALQVVEGKTIAVLAGHLQQITPVGNEKLASTIIEKNGLLLSEAPLGKPLHRADFVRRNRIQSGLSLAVCPVQTALKSGTQHTIEYCRIQERFLFTPSPEPAEMQEEAVEGNLALIEAGTFVMKDKEVDLTLEAEIEKVRKRLKEDHDRRFGKRDNYSEQLRLFDS